MTIDSTDLPPFLDRFQRTAVTVLWGSVLVFVAITLFLLRADTVVYDATNSDDIGAFDGVNAFLIVVVGIVFGLLPLVLAVWQSLAAARRKPSRTGAAAGFSAAYTAICGAVTTRVWINLTADTARDRRVEASAITDATHIYWAVGLIALVPLLVVLSSGAIRRGRVGVR